MDPGSSSPGGQGAFQKEERRVGNDNTVKWHRLCLQLPPSRLRPHFVKARVKVDVYPNGSHAVFHGPRCIGRYDETGAIKDTKDAAQIRSAASLWDCGQRVRVAHSPTAGTKAEEADI